MKVHPAVGDAEVRGMAAGLGRVLATAPFVHFAFGHGSFFERLPHHDIDVAIGTPEGTEVDHLALSALASACERLAARPVDLQVLNGTRPGFRRAATAGTLLWAQDPEEALLYAELLQRMAWDWRPLQEQIIRDLAR